MRLPSVQYLVTQAAASLKRFYLPLLFALGGTLAGIFLIEESYEAHNIYATKVFLSCVIGLPFTLGCCLFCERLTNKKFTPVIYVIAFLLIVLYCFILAPASFEDLSFRQRIVFFILVLVAHLWVSFAAYINNNEQTGFWRINEAFFTRIIISGLYSGVLYGGLCLALVALDKLLNIEIKDKVYGDLWAIVAGLFNTWFFLSGIPKDYDALKTLDKFPNWLKVFTQYILLPLVTIYLFILYIYGIRIIIKGHLPNGWVSVLIISYSIAGILALLLVNPIRNDTNSKWVKIFSRFFYIALLPLVVLLFVAIGVRVRHYGITEDRYFLIVLGLWLLGTALYFIFSKTKNIRLIPISLALIGVLTLIGPWNVFHISGSSQASRLENLFIKHNIKPATSIVSLKQDIDSADFQQINDIVSYAVDRDYIYAIKYLYPEIDIDKCIKHTLETDTPVRLNRTVDALPYYLRRRIEDSLTAFLHIEPIIKQAQSKIDSSTIFWSINDGGVNVLGYNKLLPFIVRGIDYDLPKDWRKNDSTNFNYKNNLYNLIVYRENGQVDLFKNGTFLSGANLHALLHRLENMKQKKVDSIPQDSMTVILNDRSVALKIVLTRVYFNPQLDTAVKKNFVEALDGWLLLK